MSFLSDSSKLTFKTIFPFQMNSTTRFLALIGTCVSLHALFSLVFFYWNFELWTGFYQYLGFCSIWRRKSSACWFFISSVINLFSRQKMLSFSYTTQSLLFALLDSLIGLQDDVNWLASAIGWPCLTTFFLIKVTQWAIGHRKASF